MARAPRRSDRAATAIGADAHIDLKGGPAREYPLKVRGASGRLQLDERGVQFKRAGG